MVPARRPTIIIATMVMGFLVAPGVAAGGGLLTQQALAKIRSADRDFQRSLVHREG